MFIKASDSRPTTLIFFSTNFSSEFTNRATALFPIMLQSGCLYVKGFYNHISVFLLKNSCCKTFRTVENPRKDCNFLFLSGSPFEFCKIFINSRFSKHRRGFVFAMIYCLQKEKVRKKKVLRASTLDIFFSIVSLTSSSITTNF